MMAFMAAGTMLAVAGIWLMLRETASGQAAQIVLGPLKIQSAPAGFSVFVAGAAAFTSPIVAPETTEDLIEKVASARGAGLAELGPSPERAPAKAGMPTGLVPSDAEPDNDERSGAATVRDGNLAGGQHAGENADWFRLDTADLANRRIAVRISERTRDCLAHFYDGGQSYIGLVALVPDRNEFELEVGENESFWVQLTCMRAEIDDPYQVSFDAVPEMSARTAPEEAD
jgi:hypothetical protein